VFERLSWHEPERGRLILSDELNHNSMIEGVNQSNCPKQVFRHNDLGHLEQLLTSAGQSRPKIVLFESLYSMDGDFAPMTDLRTRQTSQCIDLL
jgi:5-aminolevulinate synthase